MMMKNLNLEFKDISVGSVEGVQESKSSKFQDMFYTGNNKVEEFLDQKNFIISGRKGTGKTVLAKYVQKQEHNLSKRTIYGFQSLISTDFRLNEFVVYDGAIVERDKRGIFQKYFILTKIMYTLIDLENKISFYSFLREPQKVFFYFNYKKSINNLINFENENFNKNSKVPKTVLRKNKSTAKAGIRNSLISIDGELSSDVEFEEVQNQFYNLYEKLLGLVKKALKYCSVTFIMDDFDDLHILGFDDFQDEIYFLVDFIKNTFELNNELQIVSKHSKVVLLIRDDVFNKFPAFDANLNKILFGAIKMRWMDTHGDKSELENMVLNKIKNSNSKLKELSVSELKSTLFATISKKNTKSIFSTVTEFTFGRPRDVIVFFDLILKQNPTSRQITYKMIDSAEHTYSIDYLLGECKNELSTHFDPEYVEKVFEIIQNYGYEEFTYDEILEYSTIYSGVKSESEMTDFLNVLYQNNIIAMRIGGRKGHVSRASHANARTKIDKNQNFLVHVGLHKALNIRRGRKQ